MNPAVYATYNQQAISQAAQQLMYGQAPQNAVLQPVQKKKVFAKLTPLERGFYSNLLTKADKKGADRIQGAQAVAFLKCSGLQKDILKRIWQLAAYEDPKYLNKEEFYVALRLIAYAQNKMDVSIESVITNLPVELPKFNFAGPNDSAAQPVMPKNNQVDQAPKINVDQLPDLDSINPANFAGSSFIAPKPQQQAQLSKNVNTSPFFIAPQQLNKYKRIYENFDKDKKGYLGSKQAKQIFEKTGLSNQILKKVWTMVDFMDRGIIDNFAFIMSMHLLHRCKKGQALPNAIPQQMWASFGQDGVIYRQQLASVNAMKQRQEQDEKKKRAAEAAPPNVNLLNDSVLDQQPKQIEQVKKNDNFGNLIEDTGISLSSGNNSLNQDKNFNFQQSNNKNLSNETPRSIPSPAQRGNNNLVASPRQPLSYTEQVKDVSDPFGNIQNATQSILSPPPQPVQPVSIAAPAPQTSSNDYSYGVKNVNRALENQIQFLENQTSANNQIIRGVQTQVQRMQARRFQLQRYLQQLRQTIRNQTEELWNEKDRLSRLSQDYDAKMKGYQDNFAQMQVIQQERRNVQNEIVKKQVAIAQANISEQVVAQNTYSKGYNQDTRSNGGYSRKQSNYDQYSQKDQYGRKNSYNYQNSNSNFNENTNWGNDKSSYQQAYSNNQMGWDDSGYKWDDQANTNSNTNQVNRDQSNYKYNSNTQQQKYHQQDYQQQQQQQWQQQQQNHHHHQHQQQQQQQQQQNQQNQQQHYQQQQDLQQQDYSNQNYNEWTGNNNFENSNQKSQRRSTVSKGWRFQLYKQDMNEDQNRYNQYKGYSDQQDFQPDTFSNNNGNTGNDGFDMKFESNFSNNDGSSNQNTGGGADFKFDWGGDQGQAANDNLPKNENQDFGGGWVDFQTNSQSQNATTNQNSNNGFGDDGGMNFDFN